VALSTAPQPLDGSNRTRASIVRSHLRMDRWWFEPAITAFVLAAFVVYSSIRAFSGTNYYASPLLSPFYSPCLATNCVPGASDFGTPV